MHRLLVLTILVACGSAACVPTTTYRYSGMTPAPRPIPWDGHPSPGGQVHADATITHVGVVENLVPQLHDTALHVAATTLEGSASITPVRGLDVGLRWSYAAYAWTEPSAAGTMPLPSRPSLWGIGPEVHGAIAFDRGRHWALGAAANVMNTQLPYAEWQLAPCAPSATCVDGYQLNRAGTQAYWTFTIGLYPSYSIGPDGKYGTVFALLAASSGFKNDGFTDQQVQGSAIQSAGLVPILGSGYGVRVYPVKLGVSFYAPITDGGSAVQYGLGAMFTLGLDVTLWEPHARSRRPRPPAPVALR